MGFPKHHVFENFLPPDEHAALLAYALDHAAKFQRTTVYEGGAQVVNDERRASRKLKDGLGPSEPTFTSRIKARTADLFDAAGLKPKPVARIETELVLHNDGGHFARHIDTLTGRSRAEAGTNGVRTVSCVYYFYREPKGFENGELRLYDFEGARHVDVSPRQNSLLTFPSFASHEVLPTRCRSGALEASRFSVNCWLHCMIGNP